MINKDKLMMFCVLFLTGILFQNCEKEVQSRENVPQSWEVTKSVKKDIEKSPLTLKIDFDDINKSRNEKAIKETSCRYMIDQIHDWPIAGLPELHAGIVLCTPCTKPCKGTAEEPRSVILTIVKDGTTYTVSVIIMLIDDSCWTCGQGWSGEWI